jgi:glutamate-1-semialdehyde 2,1-aminomutase
MRLPRFLRPDERVPQHEAGAGAEAVEAGQIDAAGDEEAVPEGEPDVSWHQRAVAVLPSGTSTGSKRVEALWGSPDPYAPTHYLAASGCQLTTADNETLIDCTMALGAVALGYGDERVTQAVVSAVAHGNVSGLPHVLEVEVAERFCELVPCAEQVQFLKSGAEAMAAAVRIARAYTGRQHVVGCGYFGWHDWCSAEPGVPDGARRDITRVAFDDVAALEQAVDAAGNDLAAIVIEPVIERLPSPGWIARARELSDRAGAALVFDEMKTGFRMATGGFQELSGVTPDLAAFGKAMANGFPLAAVCGSADLMGAARSTWISSTLGGETTALAAARAVLHVYAEQDVCRELAANGVAMRRAVGNALRASRLTGITLDGIDPMWFFRFESPDLESAFLTTAAANGVLFKRGPYNFSSLAHDEATIHEIEACTSNTLVALRDRE